MKKVLSFILCLLLAISSPVPVHARESEEPDYPEQIIKADSLTGLDIALGEQIRSVDHETLASLSNYLKEHYSLSDLQKMHVNQLRISSQGISVYTTRQEKQYQDLQGNIIQENVSETIRLMRSADVYHGNTLNVWGKYDIACTVTAYYTITIYDSSVNTYVSIDHMTFQYHKAGTSSVTVSSAELIIIGDDRNFTPTSYYYQSQVYYGPSANTLYYLFSADPTQYLYGTSQICRCGAIVNLSDGSSSGVTGLCIDLT